MNSSPSSLLTLGLGAWSDASLLLLSGLGIGTQVTPVQPPTVVAQAPHTAAGGGLYIQPETLGHYQDWLVRKQDDELIELAFILVRTIP